MKVLPNYNIRLWRQTHLDAHRIVLRPGLAVALRRIAWTALAALFTGFIYYGYSSSTASPEPESLSPELENAQRRSEEYLPAAEYSLREMMTEEEYAEFQREGARKREAREAEGAAVKRRLSTLLQVGYITLVAFFAVVGILPPLAVAWNRVSIEKDARNNLIVRSWYLVPRIRAWPLDAFNCISITVQERIHHDRYGVPLDHGWYWVVGLTKKAEPTIPIPGDIGIGSGHDCPFFTVWRQKDHLRTLPGNLALPPAVAGFVSALRDLTGLSVGPPAILHASVERRGIFARPVTTYKTEPLVARTSRTYTSLDEMPPEIREKFERMRRNR